MKEHHKVERRVRLADRRTARGTDWNESGLGRVARAIESACKARSTFLGWGNLPQLPRVIGPTSSFN